MFLEIDDTRSRRVAVQELSGPLCVEGRTACGQDDLINIQSPASLFVFVLLFLHLSRRVLLDMLFIVNVRLSRFQFHVDITAETYF